jgi:hypothetical protein
MEHQFFIRQQNLKLYASVFGAIFDADGQGGLASVTADAAKAQIPDPDTWAQESFELAKQNA